MGIDMHGGHRDKGDLGDIVNAMSTMYLSVQNCLYAADEGV